MDKVSIIIPTYNRFNFLLNTIKSVQNQTYPNTEIIVVNDNSTQQDYYTHIFDNNIKIIHLEKNSKKIFGYSCAAYVRNQGIKEATGKYIAFCDDDDIWFPKKLELQINAMKESNCKMSCTDGYGGKGVYNQNKKYNTYLNQIYLNIVKKIYKKKKSNKMENGYPKIWDLQFLKIHNCCVCSSVILEKSILDKINNFKNMKAPGEDYNCWLRALKHTNCVFINNVCFIMI